MFEKNTTSGSYSQQATELWLTGDCRHGMTGVTPATNRPAVPSDPT